VQGKAFVIDMFGMQSPETDLELFRKSFNVMLLKKGGVLLQDLAAKMILEVGDLAQFQRFLDGFGIIGEVLTHPIRHSVEHTRHGHPKQAFQICVVNS